MALSYKFARFWAHVFTYSSSELNGLLEWLYWCNMISASTWSGLSKAHSCYASPNLLGSIRTRDLIWTWYTSLFNFFFDHLSSMNPNVFVFCIIYLQVEEYLVFYGKVLLNNFYSLCLEYALIVCCWAIIFLSLIYFILM